MSPIGSIPLTLICCSVLVPLSISSFLPVCKQGDNCHLPDCFCSTFNPPLDPKEIPQIVYFGLADGVFGTTEDQVNRLFRHERRNPNDCPISMTVYISEQSTNYPVLTKYSNSGFEIAIKGRSHSVTDNGDYLRREANRLRNNINMFTNITKEKINGWQSAYLKTAGDTQVNVLQNINFTYDVSLLYTRQKMADLNPWPFTLDYGWTLPCEIQPCPTNKHPGFWVVPVNAMRDYGDWGACRFLDSCVNKPLTVNQTYRYIMDNFRSHYHGNRAPFGIHMHAPWLAKEINHVEAMDLVIQDLLEYDDVYIVNINQTLEWMKRPTELKYIERFKPWSCTSETGSTITIPGILIFFLACLCISIYVKLMSKLFG